MVSRHAYLCGYDSVKSSQLFHDASSNSLSTALPYMAQQPKVIAKLRAEIDEHVGRGLKIILPWLPRFARAHKNPVGQPADSLKFMLTASGHTRGPKNYRCLDNFGYAARFFKIPDSAAH